MHLESKRVFTILTHNQEGTYCHRSNSYELTSQKLLHTLTLKFFGKPGTMTPHELSSSERIPLQPSICPENMETSCSLALFLEFGQNKTTTQNHRVKKTKTTLF
jgi:hypothetical protein